MFHQHVLLLWFKFFIHIVYIYPSTGGPEKKEAFLKTPDGFKFAAFWSVLSSNEESEIIC